jgi:hypothetical protein
MNAQYEKRQEGRNAGRARHVKTRGRGGGAKYTVTVRPKPVMSIPESL